MESLRITRERNALQAGLKELKRTQIQELCRVRSGRSLFLYMVAF